MSIYSGFPTRKDQSKYNNLLSKLITTLQHHLLQLITEVPNNKIIIYTKIISKMRDFQEHKYLPPKFSQLLDPLCKLIGYSSSSEEAKDNLVMPQIDDRTSNMDRSEKGRLESQYLFKTKQRLKSEVGIQQHRGYNKKGAPLFEDRSFMPIKMAQGLPNKKTAYQSSFDLKQRKNIHSTGNPNHKIQLTQQYQDVNVDQIMTNNGLSQKSGSSNLKYHLIPSHKGKIRYMQHNNRVLGQAQQNINKRQIPLREQMRRKLKNQQPPIAKINN